jgi:hypothetical protein
VTVPYLTAFQAGGEAAEFIGFLINPIDGNTYLAKMYQGWEGSWQYRMAFTAQPGEGAFFFPFYLFLGHVGRLTGFSLISIFHGARLMAVGFMLVNLHRFFRRILPPHIVDLSFSLAALGSGLGWLAIPFGAFTADLWVSEGFIFLSAYANPHFPLSLGLMTWVLTPSAEGGRKAPVMVLAGLLLGLILPFGLAVVLGVLGGLFILNFRREGFSSWVFNRILLISLGGLPVVLYDLWVVWTNPIYAGWNVQNITTSPPVWELFVSFSPPLLIALYSAWTAIWRDKGPSNVLVAWLGFVLILIYLPIGLQRRMLTGFYIPLAGLAVFGIDRLVKGGRRQAGLFTTLVLLLTIPTNIIVLLAAWQGIQTRDPSLYVTRDEVAAMAWIAANTGSEAVILASPALGTLIPGQTGRGVIYGHPFETIGAPEAESQVTAFYNGAFDLVDANRLIIDEDVNYIFYGPREKALGDLPQEHPWLRVFSQGDVEIFAAVDDGTR